MKRLIIFFITLYLALIAAQHGGIIAASDASCTLDSKLHDRMGDDYFLAGRKKDALLEWEKAIRLDGENPSPYFKLGNLYFQSGYLEKSLFYLDRGVCLLPTSGFAHFNLALALDACGREARAEEEFQKAILFSPRPNQDSMSLSPSGSTGIAGPLGPSDLAHFFLAFLYMKKKEYGRAVFELKRSFVPASCFSQKPYEEAVTQIIDHMEGGKAYSGGRLDALALDQAFIGLKSGDGSPVYMRHVSLSRNAGNRLVSREGYDTGITVPQKTTDLFLDDEGNLQNRVVRIDRGTGRHLDGGTIIGKLAIVSFPHPEGLRPLRGGSWRETPASGRPVEASRHEQHLLCQGYARGMPVVPPDSQEWSLIVSKGMELASSQDLRQKYAAFCEDDEKRVYEQSLARGMWPTHLEALNYLARWHTAQCSYREAEQELTEALKASPLNPFIHFNAGYLYWRTGRMGPAADEFRKALGGFTSDSSYGAYDLPRGRAHFYLGLIEKSRKNDKEAMRHLKAALALDPLTGVEACLPLSQLYGSAGNKTSSLIYLLEFLRAHVVSTSNPLDVALLGEGYFQLIDSHGGIIRSRKGDFTLTASGEIMTHDGSRSGITIPEGVSDLQWTKEGALTGVEKSGATITLGALKLVTPSGSPSSAPLRSGYLNLPTSLTAGGEAEAWRLLNAYCTADNESRHLFLTMLIDGTIGDEPPRASCFSTYCGAKSSLYGGNLAEALKMFEICADECGENEFVLCQREALLAYLEKGRASREILRDTIESLEKLHIIHPDADLYLGWLNERTGSNDNALIHYTKFLEGEKEGAKAAIPMILCARLYRIAGSSNFAGLEALMPHHPGMIAQGFSLCSTMLPQKKSATLRPIMDFSLEEKRIFAHLRRGMLLEKRGACGEAIEEYRRVVRARGLGNPHLSSFYSEDLVRALFKAGLLDEARNELDLMRYDYHFCNPSLANLFKLLGKAYEEKGEKGKAYECTRTMEEIEKELKSRNLRL
jgi:tetratricopeptide (TPR) repeat protein